MFAAFLFLLRYLFLRPPVLRRLFVWFLGTTLGWALAGAAGLPVGRVILVEGGWQEQKTSFAYKIIAQIGQFAPNLKSLITNHEFLTPQDIERQYHVRQGHWHHGEMTIHQSFMMRPVHGAAQYDTPIDGLYLCGAGAHPGGGLTGLPGHNAAKRILETGVAK